MQPTAVPCRFFIIEAHIVLRLQCVTRVELGQNLTEREAAHYTWVVGTCSVYLYSAILSYCMSHWDNINYSTPIGSSDVDLL